MINIFTLEYTKSETIYKDFFTLFNVINPTGKVCISLSVFSYYSSDPKKLQGRKGKYKKLQLCVNKTW